MQERTQTSKVPAPGLSANTPWLDYTAAAEYAFISVNKLQRLVGERVIPSYQPSGRTLLRKDDLDAWIMSGKREAL
jgi:excisionase family DNA binding protein